MVDFSLGNLVVHGYNIIVELMQKDFVGVVKNDNILESAKVKEIELSNGQSGVAIDNNPFLAFGVVRKKADNVKSVDVGDYVYISFSLMTPENMFFLDPVDMLTTGVTNYLCIGEHSIKASYKAISEKSTAERVMDDNYLSGKDGQRYTGNVVK